MSVDSDPLPRLLSLAVHEIRTPVTVVNGYLTMLLREQGGPLNERQRHMLSEAERSCRNLAVLADQMSEVRKLESREIKFAQVEIDIAALLVELASGMHEGEDRGVRLELRGVDRPIMVSGDRPRLTEALETLMFVTLREHGHPGAVVVHCSTMTHNGAGYAHVALADESLLPHLTGPCINDQLKFDEYRGGTGFRLPFARRVIEEHGGTIWSAATSQELRVLDADRRSHNPDLSLDERGELLRKRATVALQLPLRT
jgi:signal transduction histidine kinase